MMNVKDDVVLVVVLVVLLSSAQQQKVDIGACPFLCLSSLW